MRELSAGTTSRVAIERPGSLDRVAARALERGLGLVEVRQERSVLERWISGEEDERDGEPPA